MPRPLVPDFLVKWRESSGKIRSVGLSQDGGKEKHMGNALQNQQERAELNMPCSGASSVKSGAGTEKAGWDCQGSGHPGARDGRQRGPGEVQHGQNQGGSQSRVRLGLRVTFEFLHLFKIRFYWLIVCGGRRLWWK